MLFVCITLNILSKRYWLPEILSLTNENISGGPENLSLTNERLSKGSENLPRANERLSEGLENLSLANERLSKGLENLSLTNERLSEGLENLQKELKELEELALRAGVKAECFCLYYFRCTLKKVLALTPLTPYYLLAGNLFSELSGNKKRVKSRFVLTLPSRK